jgi:hypothetical protein
MFWRELAMLISLICGFETKSAGRDERRESRSEGLWRSG